MRLWGGRFAEENDQRVADFTRSIDLDRELAADDITGSIAHVRGLARAGLLTDEEVEELLGGLTELAQAVAEGTLTWDPTLEDVHLNLEAALAERIGAVAGKLHTGRSRNDQVATDLRLSAAPGDRSTGRRAARLRARPRGPGGA
ncbi:MAG: lyase family protein [Candidatus Limnocylindrales bacterium]